MGQWVRAAERHPEAINADPEVFARNICLYGEDPDLAAAPLCVEVAAG